MVNLHSAFGDSVQASLINLPCSIVSGDGLLTTPIVLNCAVTDKLKTHCLLTTQDYCDMINNTGIESCIPDVAIVTSNKLLATDDLVKLNCKSENSLSDVSSALETQLMNAAICDVKVQDRTCDDIII